MRIQQGEARGRRLEGPRDQSTRPLLDQIRESLFGRLGDVFESKAVLDLFCGVGSFGLEALSRGARWATFVDASRSTLEILERNLETLGFGPRAEVLRGDALKVPDESTPSRRSFAVAFLDPPFKMFASREATDRVLARTKALLASPILEPGGLVLLRVPTQPGHTEALQELESIPMSESKTHGESTIFQFRSGRRAVC